MTSPTLRARLERESKALGIETGVTTLASKIQASVAKVLNGWQAVSMSDGAGALGLEHYDGALTERNKSFNTADADVQLLLTELKGLNVPARQILGVAEQIINTFERPQQNINSVVQLGYDTTKAYEPLSNVIGASSAAMIAGEGDSAGLEAFGEDTNRMATDDRMVMNLMIMRPWDNIMDKGLGRVNDSSPVVIIRVPEPQAYDWATTQQNGSTSDSRNGPSNTYPIRDLYRNPQAVNSRAKKIVAVRDSDSTQALWSTGVVDFYKTNREVQLLDISRDGNKVSYDRIDRTDLVSDGGRLDSVVFSITDPNSGNPVTEFFKINTRSIDLSMFVRSPSARASGQQQLMMPVEFPISATTKAIDPVTGDAKASTIAAKLTDAKISVRMTVNASLNIQTGTLQASGPVNLNVVPLAGGTVSNATQTYFGTLSSAFVAYSVETYFNEENQRKANLAIWVQYHEKQFVIPRSRVFFTEYSLTQDIDENAIAATSSMIALGNGRRGLGIIVNALADVSDTLKFVTENPEVALSNTLNDHSFASSLVKPTVVTAKMDFTSEEVNDMNESTRLVEMHGRFRARILLALATMFAKSLMLNQYKSGETPVIKVWTHSTIADIIIGIDDYHPDLKDRATTASGADYSMTLPNGYRLDIIKSNLDCLEGRLFALPVIESDMTSILSGASIRDCGTVSTNYSPTNYGAVTKRVATTTREIVMMSNPVGVCMEIGGFAGQVGAVGLDRIDLNADSSNTVVL